MRCFYSARAADDLDDIAEYIARDNPQRALSFIDELRERCTLLTAFPENAPLRRDIAEGIRLVPFGRYLILYSVGDDAVLVERVLHGARDIPEAFSGTA
jgi:toxin ParE1/3/4